MFLQRVKNNKQNLMIGAVWFILGVYVLVESLRLGLGTLRQPGSGFFLFVVGFGIIVFTVGWMISAFLNDKDQNVSYNWQGFKKVLLINIVFLIYIFLVNKIGFIVMSFLFLITFMFLIESVKLLKSIIAAAATTGLIYVLFVKILELRLPSGILF